MAMVREEVPWREAASVSGARGMRHPGFYVPGMQAPFHRRGAMMRAGRLSLAEMTGTGATQRPRRTQRTRRRDKNLCSFALFAFFAIFAFILLALSRP
jgi:hypothetical protein